MIKDYMILALRNLRKRRLRSWLTIIGIFISIATIFILISLSLGLRFSIEEQFRILGTDKFFIMPKGQLGTPGTGGAIKMTIDDVEVVEKDIGVKRAIYLVNGNAKVDYKGQTRYFSITGIPMEGFDLYAETAAFKIEEGKMISEGKKGRVIIGNDYKNRKLFKKPIGVGDIITINGKVFKVEGILAPIGNPQDDRIILMEFSEFQEVFNSEKRIDMMIVQVKEGENTREISERVEKRLRDFRGVNEKTQDFYISTPEELLENFGLIINIISVFLISIAAISLLVGGIGITNTM
ncbi:MAG: ABC transporter permease, partial [Candidatus Pacearchaeota archaeon]